MKLLVCLNLVGQSAVGQTEGHEGGLLVDEGREVQAMARNMLEVLQEEDLERPSTGSEGLQICRLHPTPLPQTLYCIKRTLVACGDVTCGCKALWKVPGSAMRIMSPWALLPTPPPP